MWQPRAGCHSHPRDREILFLRRPGRPIHLALLHHRLSSSPLSSSTPSGTVWGALLPADFHQSCAAQRLLASTDQKALIWVASILPQPASHRDMAGSAMAQICSVYPASPTRIYPDIISRTPFAELLSDMYNETLNALAGPEDDLCVVLACAADPC